MSKAVNQPADFGLSRWIFAGGALVFFVVVLVGGWGALAQIASAVIASGRVVVESNPKLVQHREGGIVGQIAIGEGDQVSAGDLLVRLDGATTRANLAIVTKQLVELDAQSARLSAIAEGEDSIVFPDTLSARENEPEIASILAAEQRLFAAHQSMLGDEYDQLKERIRAYRSELANYRQRSEAASRELALLKEEQEGLEQLYEKKFVSLNRLNQGKRAMARLEGEIATASAYASDTQGRLTEAELSFARLTEEARTKALEEWRDKQAERVQLEERRIAAEDMLNRLEIRAPQDGVVHELEVHTIGGVVTPGQTLMQVVPVNDNLVVEGRVRPTDIDEVHVGQMARIRFPALSLRSTPDVYGTVVHVGADLSIEEYTDQPYFDIRIELSEDQLMDIAALGLVPGMPAEVFVQTGERSALAYLLQPLEDHINRAFRE